MEGLPQDYIIQNLYSFCKRPVYKKFQGTYNAECCICHEGSSAGSKRRLFYFPSERYFYCFNCSRSWSELNWIQEVTGKSYHEVLRDSKSYDSAVNLVTMLSAVEDKKEHNIPSIPEDSVDLTDSNQCDYYKGTTQYKILSKALEYCSKRKLFTAVNRPSSLYISFTDYVHKNRLIIPFYSDSNKIESYQSRSLNGDDYPKYLTKYGDKCLYGENNIDPSIPYIFVFEGPIDAMFVKNGVAIGGSTLTEKQEIFLNKCFGQEIIYVYDNDKDNKEMDKKIRSLIDKNKKVFIWPKELQKFKDINEVCCQLDINEFSYSFIVNNSFTGIEAKMKFKVL